MIYDILPISSLSWQDIRDTLNSQGSNIGNSVSIAGALINQWSKHKPVKRDSIDFCQDFDSSKPNYIPEWWKGDDGYCGLIFNMYKPSEISGTTSFSNFIEKYSDDKYGYTYNKPTEKLRIGDFAAYYKSAQFESKDFVPTSSTGYKQNSPIIITVAGDIKDSYHNISIKDLNGMEKWYIGALIYLDSGGTKIYQGRTTVEIPTENTDRGGATISLPEGFRDTGTYVFYPIVSETMVYGELNKNDDSRFIIYPCKPFEVIVSQLAGTNISGQAAISKDKTKATIEIRLRAGDEQSVYTFSNLEFSIIKKEDNQSPVTLFAKSIDGSFNVNEGETKVLTYEYTDMGYDFDYYEELILQGVCYMKISVFDGKQYISFEEKSVFISTK